MQIVKYSKLETVVLHISDSLRLPGLFKTLQLFLFMYHSVPNLRYKQ